MSTRSPSPLRCSLALALLVSALPLCRAAAAEPLTCDGDGALVTTELNNGTTMEACTAADADGPIKDGPYRILRADGGVSETGTFVMGARDGEVRTYHRTGGPKSSTTWAGGRKEGPSRGWLSGGQMWLETAFVAGKEHGQRREWRSGGALRLEGAMQAGEPTGRWVWYAEDGTVEKEEDRVAEVDAPDPVTQPAPEPDGRLANQTEDQPVASPAPAAGRTLRGHQGPSKSVRKAASTSRTLGDVAIPMFIGGAVLAATTPAMFAGQMDAGSGPIIEVVLPTPAVFALEGVGLGMAMGSFVHARSAHHKRHRRNGTNVAGLGMALAIAGMAMHGGVVIAMVAEEDVEPAMVGVNMLSVGLYVGGIAIIEGNAASLRSGAMRRGRAELGGRPVPRLVGAWIGPTRGGATAGVVLSLP